jgi:hypothetical protein
MKDDQLPTIDIGALANVTGGCGGGNTNQQQQQQHHHHHHGNGGGGCGGGSGYGQGGGYGNQTNGGVDVGITYGGVNGDNGTAQVRQPGRYHPV